MLKLVRITLHQSPVHLLFRGHGLIPLLGVDFTNRLHGIEQQCPVVEVGHRNRIRLARLAQIIPAAFTEHVLPVFAENILNIGAVGYGYFQAAPGLGAIFALIGLTLLTYYRGKIKLLIGAGALLGISLLGFSASRWVFLSLPLLVVTGGAMATFMAVNTTLIQTHIPDEVRGRVMSWREIAMGLGPAGSMLFGAIAQYTGVPISLGLLGGIVLIASLLLMAFLPRFRSLE